MSKFESSIKIIPYSQTNVYRMLSDLDNIERIKDKLPNDKISDLAFDRDSVSFSISPIGNVSMRIIDREEPKTIKFGSDSSPVDFKFWIQLLPIGDKKSKIKLTIDANIPFFAKKMVAEPLRNGIEKVAEVLSKINYI